MKFLSNVKYTLLTEISKNTPIKEGELVIGLVVVSKKSSEAKQSVGFYNRPTNNYLNNIIKKVLHEESLDATRLKYTEDSNALYLEAIIGRVKAVDDKGCFIAEFFTRLDKNPSVYFDEEYCTTFKSNIIVLTVNDDNQNELHSSIKHIFGNSYNVYSDINKYLIQEFMNLECNDTDFLELEIIDQNLKRIIG